MRAARDPETVESSLGELGLPRERADQIADALSQSGGGSRSDAFGEATGRVLAQQF